MTRDPTSQSMPSQPNLFDQVTTAVGQHGTDQILDLLEGHFRRSHEYFSLFEILKLRCRHKLNLPLIASTQPENLPAGKQRELDDGLIDACQTVGTLLFHDGNLQHGWTYLQPGGNQKLAESLIREVAVTHENAQTLIDIALSQGGAPAYGYRLLIQHHGTCNAITAFDVRGKHFDRATQAAMASELLGHVYAELVENIRDHIHRENEEPRSDASLTQLLEQHPWLVEQKAYHLDTTHLASLMRIARSTTSEQDFRLALELAQYGLGLPENFQHPSPAPFENTYPDHQIFFRALLGQQVDEAMSHFQKKCTETASLPTDASPAEEMIDFCYRLGKIDEAIAHATRIGNANGQTIGMAPDVTEMAESPEQFANVLEHLRQKEDLLGYALVALRQQRTLKDN